MTRAGLPGRGRQGPREGLGICGRAGSHTGSQETPQAGHCLVRPEGGGALSVEGGVRTPTLSPAQGPCTQLFRPDKSNRAMVEGTPLCVQSAPQLPTISWCSYAA